MVFQGKLQIGCPPTSERALSHFLTCPNPHFHLMVSSCFFILEKSYFFWSRKVITFFLHILWLQVSDGLFMCVLFFPGPLSNHGMVSSSFQRVPLFLMGVFCFRNLPREEPTTKKVELPNWANHGWFVLAKPMRIAASNSGEMSILNARKLELPMPVQDSGTVCVSVSRHVTTRDPCCSFSVTPGNQLRFSSQSCTCQKGLYTLRCMR